MGRVVCDAVSTFDRLVAWDEAVLLQLSRWQHPRATRVLRAVTHLGDWHSLTLVGLVLILSEQVETHRLGWLLGLSAGGVAAAAQVIKRLSRRPRPSAGFAGVAGVAGFTALVANPDAFSFPSGHTAAMVALAVAWAGEGNGLGALMACLAATVAFSRLYLGAHYPLDVMAGSALGLVTGALARWVAT